jgi:hypothetical protein
MANQKVPVSERALFARCDRALKKNGESLKRSRDESASFHELGRFYTVDIQRNVIAAKDVDLEQLARELDVLRPFEALSER